MMRMNVRHLAGGAFVLLLVALLVFGCAGFFIGCEPFWEDEDDSGEDDVVYVDESQPEADEPEPEAEEPGDDESTIWYSGVRNVNILEGQAPPPLVDAYTELDVNGDSTPDYIFVMPVPYEDLVVTPTEGNKFSGPHSGGASINGELQWSEATQYMASWRVLLDGQQIGCAGPWCGVTSGYMGLQFRIGGSAHFGWARISVDDMGVQITLHDWAYETQAGVGIRAGQKE